MFDEGGVGDKRETSPSNDDVVQSVDTQLTARVSLPGPQLVPPQVIHNDVCSESGVKEDRNEGASDARDGVMAGETLQNDEVSKSSLEMAQLDNEAKRNDDDVQDFSTEMEWISEDLRVEIEAQLLSATPIFNSHGQTALHRAAASGLGGVVARLLAGCPALFYAISHFDGVAPALHFAARSGRAETVAQLLAVDPALIDARSGFGWTPLHCAAFGGHVVTVAQLLAAKASIEARTEDGQTVLHCAVNGKQTEVVAQLLAAKPTSIDARTGDGRTVLHFALGHDKITAQLLAAHPALLDAIIDDDDSWTALMNVVKMNHEQALSRLLATYPNLIHRTSRHGWTVFHFAARHGRDKVMARLVASVSQPDLEQLLLQGSTARSDRASEGSTALHVAALMGHSDIVAQLLAAWPALIDALDENGRTCLHCAAMESHKSTVELLLAFKPALVQAVDAQRNTILHSMLDWLQTTFVGIEVFERVLKMNPSAAHAVNCQGDSPFALAVATRNDSAMDLLQSSVTLEELVSVYGKWSGMRNMARFATLIEQVYEQLAMVLLRDLVSIVRDFVS